MNPTRTRPDIPDGYGISAADDGLLDWERVANALADANIYWFSTVSAAGTPHLVPLHAAAIDGTIRAAGDPATRWSRNLDTEPRLTVGVEHDGLQVMAKGTAVLETVGAGAIDQINESVQAKYGFSYGAEGLDMWSLSPETVIAFDPGEFATSPTRFTFGGVA